MAFPDGISDRDLLDALYARVEQLEGVTRLYRAALTATISAMPPSQQAIASERLAMLKADVLTEWHHPKGQYLRGGPETLAATQRLGLETEWRQLAQLLQDNAPGR